MDDDIHKLINLRAKQRLFNENIDSEIDEVVDRLNQKNGARECHDKAVKNMVDNCKEET